jgi:hypothetical protein
MLLLELLQVQQQALLAQQQGQLQALWLQEGKALLEL